VKTKEDTDRESVARWLKVIMEETWERKNASFLLSPAWDAEKGQKKRKQRRPVTAKKNEGRRKLRGPYKRTHRAPAGKNPIMSPGEGTLFNHHTGGGG